MLNKVINAIRQLIARPLAKKINQEPIAKLLACQPLNAADRSQTKTAMLAAMESILQTGSGTEMLESMKNAIGTEWR